ATKLTAHVKLEETVSLRETVFDGRF
ncbi:hypothetical protein THAOC_22577, partial [Thalassiosira oceanica]